MSEEDRKKYGKVMEKLDSHFDVRKNVIFERARFNRQRNQLDGETAEEYMYSLVETCEFGALKDEMIRDRLVVGIRDLNLAEKLRMDATLTLDNDGVLSSTESGWLCGFGCVVADSFVSMRSISCSMLLIFALSSKISSPTLMGSVHGV